MHVLTEAKEPSHAYEDRCTDLLRRSRCCRLNKRSTLLTKKQKEMISRGKCKHHSARRTHPDPSVHPPSFTLMLFTLLPSSPPLSVSLPLCLSIALFFPVCLTFSLYSFACLCLCLCLRLRLCLCLLPLSKAGLLA